MRHGSLALALASVALLTPGCVERRLIVRSDPVPAKVFLDGRPCGTTPVTIPFTYYGTREVVLRAPKHRVARVVEEIAPPWYQYTPLDLVTELLIPWTIEDERVLEVKLEPAPRTTEADVKALREHAGERRREGT